MLVWMCFAVLLIIVSTNDFLFFRIENEYIWALLALYAISCIFGICGDNFGETIKIAAIAFAGSFVLNQYGLMGGGDVKLLFPLILFAEDNLSDFILGTAIGGFCLSIVYMMFHEKIFELRRKICLITSSLKKKKFRSLRFVLLSLYRIDKRSVVPRQRKSDLLKREVPYGIALSCGGFCVIWSVMCR